MTQPTKSGDPQDGNHEFDPMRAIDAAMYSAMLSEPIIDHPDGRRHVFVPQGFALQDVTSGDRLPGHIAQAVEFDDRQSLTGYANRFSDSRSLLMADYDAGTISARLDWHNPNGVEKSLQAQKNTHAAVLRLRDSEEFARWNEMEGELHPQDEFAFFIEENVADVVSPDHSVLLEICRDLEATQGVSFKSGVRLENGDRTFRYETETRVKSEIAVPTEIRLLIPLYFGEDPVEVTAKFRFRPAPDGLRLGFRWHRVEYTRQAIFRQMAFTASEETGLPVFIGRT